MIVRKIINGTVRQLDHYATVLKNKAIVALFNFFYRPYSALRFKKVLSDNKPNPQYLTKFSDTLRDIEILESDKTLEEVVFACYFTKRIDPQSGILRSVPDIDYIKPWYDSIKRQNINGIIIHDGIDETFIKKYQTEKIQFRKFTAGKYAVFDERWILYFMFISQTNIKRTFCTDISDVFITANPFITCNKEDVLYIGRDNANKIRHSGWILSEIDRFEKNSGYRIPASFVFQQLYNVGVVGGSRIILLFFLSKVIDMILLTESEPYKEMTVLNLVIHKYFFPKLKYFQNEPIFTDPRNDSESSHLHLVSGYPFNSEFKKYENDSKALFIHK
jgi:hypothetical protein